MRVANPQTVCKPQAPALTHTVRFRGRCQQRYRPPAATVLDRVLTWLDAALLGEPGPVADPNALQLTEPQDSHRPQCEGHCLAQFAAGCFWQVEHALAATPGVAHTLCGYTQGRLEKPRYSQVCSGRSGHVEAVRVEFDPGIVSYAQLLDVWWACVQDPLDGRGQGGDRGLQYRLGLYWYDSAQREVAEKYIATKGARWKRPLAIDLKPAAPFWPAEEVHQCYIAKGGLDPESETPFWMGQYVD